MSDVTPVPLDEAYLKEISGGLDRAAKHADEQAFDPATERIVIFSDHHRGTGDAADDFRRCEHAYTAALGYYLEAGYRLFLLGDVEELWEERAGPVIDHYRAVIELEAEFTTRGRPGALLRQPRRRLAQRRGRSSSTCGRCSGRSRSARRCG